MTGQSARRQEVLLCVCYLSQMLIGTAQPFGLPAAALAAVLLAGTLAQLGLYRLLAGRPLPRGRAFTAALFALLCLMAGYDLIRADRFYRAVTAQGLSFWWLVGCMLLIGWYAAGCGRATLVRAALPVLVLLAVSMAALAAQGRYRLEDLALPQAAAVDMRRAGAVFVEYTFSGEVLLWACWQQPAGAAHRRRVPAAAVWLRFGVMAAFALLGEMALGARFARTPQVFGMLSLVGSAAHTGHGSAVYHGIWLTALALRTGAVCCTLRTAGAHLLPCLRTAQRLAAEGAGLAAAAALWTALWRQNCLCALALGIAALLAGILCRPAPKKGGGTS